MQIGNSPYSNSSDSFRNKTLQEYKNDYPELLDYYKTLNEDNDEINFVKSEIKLIKEYIKPVVKNQKTVTEQQCGFDLDIEMIKPRLSSYFKMISFLESKKTEIIHLESTIPDREQKESTISQSENGFTISLRHIALKAYYEGKHITEQNASEFLVRSEFTSHKKLYQYYTFYATNIDRKANPQSKTKLKNKIKLFKEVTSLLPEDKRGKAIDETKILEGFIPLY